jgi:stage V sporulation protein SpoVS
MRATLFGRWVGRAAVFAALGFGVLVAGGVASAATYVDRAEVPAVGPAVTSAATESVAIAFTIDWE